MVPPLPQPPDPHPPPPHHHPAPPYLHPRLLQPPFRRRSVAENVREEATSPHVLQDPPQGPPRRLLPAPPPPHPSTSGPLCATRWRASATPASRRSPRRSLPNRQRLRARDPRRAQRLGRCRPGGHWCRR